MRIPCAVLLLVAASLGDHVPYSSQLGAQKGLLVLPKQGPTLSTTTTTPAPRNNNEENLEDVNARILEQLKQQQNSQQGEYHVYLQDGRLQKVQYTTAPITSSQQTQQYASNNYNNQQQGSEQGEYHVYLQDGRLQKVQYTTAPITSGQQTQQQQYASDNYNQQQGSEQGEYHVYLQDGRLQKVQYITAPITSGQQTQQQQYASNNYNQQQQTPAILSPEFAEKRGAYFVQVPQERLQQLKNYYNQQISQQSSQTAQGLNSFQLNQQSAQTNFQFPEPQRSSGQYTEAQKDYLASVQFSPVEPISGPVYSYKPQPLTRILRYTPAFY